jgi:hypothetical protein
VVGSGGCGGWLGCASAAQRRTNVLPLAAQPVQPAQQPCPPAAGQARAAAVCAAAVGADAPAAAGGDRHQRRQPAATATAAGCPFDCLPARRAAGGAAAAGPSGAVAPAPLTCATWRAEADRRGVAGAGWAGAPGAACCLAPHAASCRQQLNAPCTPLCLAPCAAGCCCGGGGHPSGPAPSRSSPNHSSCSVAFSPAQPASQPGTPRGCMCAQGQTLRRAAGSLSV